MSIRYDASYQNEIGTGCFFWYPFTARTLLIPPPPPPPPLLPNAPIHVFSVIVVVAAAAAVHVFNLHNPFDSQMFIRFKAQRGRSVAAPSMVLITRNERVTSTNNRVDTTIPNVDGAAVLETWQFKVLDYLFSIPLFNDALFGVYRKQQVKKAEGMGIKWTAFLDDLNRNKERLL